MTRLRHYLPLLLLVISSYSLGEEVPQDPSGPCFAAIADKPELQILKGKVVIGGGSPTLEMLASTKKPTKAEKVAISAWVATAEECMRMGESWRAQNYPASVNSMMGQRVVSAKALIADLYAGKISYGAYAKTWSADDAKYKVELNDLVQKLLAERKAQQEKQAQDDQRRQQDEQKRQQELADRNQTIEQQNALIRAQTEQAQAQQETARRQQALQALQNMQRQQAIQQQQQIDIFRSGMSRPQVQTNCYTYGSNTNCTSR